jgi:PAS domain S-box-containing protein
VGKALRECEVRYRRLVERMNDDFGELDRDMRFTYDINQFCQILGYSRKETMHRLITDFLDSENKAVMDAERNNRVEGSTEVYEINWIRKTS